MVAGDYGLLAGVEVIPWPVIIALDMQFSGNGTDKDGFFLLFKRNTGLERAVNQDRFGQLYMHWKTRHNGNGIGIKRIGELLPGQDLGPCRLDGALGPENVLPFMVAHNG